LSFLGGSFLQFLGFSSSSRSEGHCLGSSRSFSCGDSFFLGKTGLLSSFFLGSFLGFLLGLKSIGFSLSSFSFGDSSSLSFSRGLGSGSSSLLLSNPLKLLLSFFLQGS
jgi:hypothetical protein